MMVDFLQVLVRKYSVAQLMNSYLARPPAKPPQRIQGGVSYQVA